MENMRQVWSYLGDFLDVTDDQLNRKFVDSIVRQVSMMCQNMFVWNNLPETIEPYMIEQWLWGVGWCGFAYDERYGYVALSSNQFDLMSVNYRPTHVTMVGNGTYFDRLVYYGTETERTLLNQTDTPFNENTACVVIRNNPQYVSSYQLLYPYIYAYYATKRKEITMLDQLQLQSLIMASPEDRPQLEGLKKDIRKNKPIITLNIKGMKSEPKPLVLANNSSLLDLQTLAKSLYGEIMERIGINSLNYEKRERMITDEVDQNKEQTMATSDILLKERQLACDRINELFGLNISVELNSDIQYSETDADYGVRAQDAEGGYPPERGGE